ncbi:Hemin-binding periplasmic protein HmuT [bacterium HR26]|nr:Hemin-binding periplasmic protein HmuT [bacterium HR26]
MPTAIATAEPTIFSTPALAPTPPSTAEPTRTGEARPASPEAEPQLPVTVIDVEGREVAVTDVSRIVPLNGDIAEIVWALGLGENVVGVDTSARYPPEARQLPSIGYQRRLSAEGILSLNPTVIVGTQEAGPPEVIQQLRDAGVPVILVEDKPSLETPGAKIRAVARALGVPGRGEALARKTEQEIAEAKALAARARSKPRVLFLYLRGTRTQMIGGLGTDAHVMIEAAGAIDAGAESGIVEYKPLTPEALVAAQPDVLLLLEAGLESVGGVDGLLQLPGIAETPAGQNRRVVALDDLYLLGMGPRTGQALRDLVLALHPELQQG